MVKDTSLILDLGRSHMPQCYGAHVPQLLKPAHPESVPCNQRSHGTEKPVNALEKARTWQRRPSTAVSKKYLEKIE